MERRASEEVYRPSGTGLYGKVSAIPFRSEEEKAGKKKQQDLAERKRIQSSGGVPCDHRIFA